MYISVCEVVVIVVVMDPVSASIPLTDINKKKKRPGDLEAQVFTAVVGFDKVDGYL